MKNQKRFHDFVGDSNFIEQLVLLPILSLYAVNN